MYKANIRGTELYVTNFGPDTNQITIGTILDAQTFTDINECYSLIFNEAEFYPAIILLDLIAISPDSPLINP